jgi:hypothetical protein
MRDSGYGGHSSCDQNSALPPLTPCPREPRCLVIHALWYLVHDASNYMDTVLAKRREHEFSLHTRTEASLL